MLDSDQCTIPGIVVYYAGVLCVLCCTFIGSICYALRTTFEGFCFSTSSIVAGTKVKQAAQNSVLFLQPHPSRRI